VKTKIHTEAVGLPIPSNNNTNLWLHLVCKLELAGFFALPGTQDRVECGNYLY